MTTEARISKKKKICLPAHTFIFNRSEFRSGIFTLLSPFGVLAVTPFSWVLQDESVVWSVLVISFRILLQMGVLRMIVPIAFLCPSRRHPCEQAGIQPARDERKVSICVDMTLVGRQTPASVSSPSTHGTLGGLILFCEPHSLSSLSRHTPRSLSTWLPSGLSRAPNPWPLMGTSSD